MASYKVQTRGAQEPLFISTEASSGGVRVSWIWYESASRTICDIFRGTTNVYSDAIKVGDTFSSDFFLDLAVEPTTTYYYWIRGRTAITNDLSNLVGPSSVTTPAAPEAEVAVASVTPDKLAKNVPVLNGGATLTAYNQARFDGSSQGASWTAQRAFIAGNNSSINLGGLTATSIREVTQWGQWTNIAYQADTGFSVASKVDVELGLQLQFGAISALAGQGEMACYARLAYSIAGANQPILFSYEWNLYRSIGGVVRHATNILNWRFKSGGAQNNYGDSAIIFDANKRYDIALQVMKTRENTALDMAVYNLGCYLDISYVPIT